MHTWFSTAWDDGAILPELLLTESLLAGSELSSGPAQSRVIIGFSILSWACFLKSVLDPGRSVLMHRVFANSWNREDLPISFLETDDFLNVKWNIELLNCAVLKCQEKPLFLQAELQCGLILCLWNNSRLQGKKLFFTTLKKKEVLWFCPWKTPGDTGGLWALLTMEKFSFFLVSSKVFLHVV